MTQPKRTSLTLIRRLQSGGVDRDWEAFQSFYWSIITGWARARGCPPPMIEDVYQDTMVSLLRYIGSYDPEKGSFRSFVRTITMRRVDDVWRSHYSVERGQTSADNPATPLVDNLDQLAVLPEEQVGQEDAVWLAGVVGEALERTFARIDDTTYKSFCRNLLEGASIDRVCEELGVNRNAVYNHKNRTLLILCEEMSTVLVELDDPGLPSLTTSTPEAMQRLRHSLEAYLANREDLRITGLTVAVPYSLTMRINEFADLLAKHPAPDSDSSWLWVIDDGCSFWAEAIDGLTIGSRDNAGLVLRASGVSRLHASLHRVQDTTWEMVDEQSTHGLWICGDRVSTKTLRGGDQIQLGSALLYFVPGYKR